MQDLNRSTTITDLARDSGFSVHTLRYYERIGLLDPIARNESGHRVYDSFAIEWVTLLRNLRDTGMPIRTMQEFATLVRQGEETIPERVRVLEEHRASIVEQIDLLNEALARVDTKLHDYAKGEAITPRQEGSQ